MNELLRLLRRLDATHAVCAWCDPRTGALMALAGAPYRIGFSAAPANLYGDHLPWRRKQLRFARWIERFAAVLMRRPLLTNQLLRRHHAQHHIQDWQQVADALGLAMDTSEPCLALGTGVRHAEPAERRRRIVIHPGASEPQKRWPLEGFLRLARSLGAEYDVLLIEPPELRFDSSIHSSFPVATTRDIPELVGYLRESDVLIGNDSGVAHLADAMGNPVISIFLASQPGHFAPYGSRNYVISFSESCDVRPCYGRCTKPGFICHLPATYEDVEARVRAHLGAILDTGGMERRH